MRALFRSLAFLAWASVAVAAQGEPLLPKGGTVILLTGLPGDVEHERQYREELMAWLELLGRGGEPRPKVVVLTDVDVTSPPLPADVRPATREAFLRLPAPAGPVLVIAWGHGGLQGGVPVFHVRGQRLTASDFRDAAARFPKPSRFVLLFRGSGAFARAVNARGHEVLASEGDTPLSHDPIGMRLLLSALADAPALSFADAARELGRRTLDYYDERGLARTEEPTLWPAGGAPRRLAVRDERPKTRTLEEWKPAESRAPSAAWSGVEPVAADRFAGSDAVVLRRAIRATLADRPAVTIEREEFVQLLTAEGKRHGDFVFEYAPADEELLVLDAEVRRPDGVLLRVPPEAVRDISGESFAVYAGPRRKLLSMPGLSPGAILRLRTRRSWNSFPLPHVSLALPLEDGLPVLDETVEVTVPKDAPFHHLLRGLPPSQPDVTSSQYGTTRRWRFRDRPRRRLEALAPQAGPELLVSTFPDWAAFAGWYARLCRLADEVTPAIAARARELTASARTDRDRLRALYDHVTSMRYVAVPLGVSSLRPHAAADVLANGFGDCKDKANLLNALLASLDIEASLVLVPRFSEAHQAVPGLSFNHAISVVRLPGETLYLDTTDDIARFGFLPPGDPGRNVLVADGKATALVRLPAPRAEENRLTVRGTVRLGGAAHGEATITATATGFPDYALRAASRRLGEEAAGLPLLASGYRLANGTLALRSQTSTDVSLLDRDWEWKAEGVLHGLWPRNGMLRPPVFLPLEWEVALHQRESALSLHQGYPIALDQEVSFLLDSVSLAGPLPAVAEIATGPLRFRLDWLRDGDRLTARLRVTLPSAEIAAGDVPELRRALTALLDALASGPALTAAAGTGKGGQGGQSARRPP